MHNYILLILKFKTMEQQINLMKKQVKVLWMIILIFGLLFVGLGIYTISTNIKSRNLISTKGIIILNENGFERTG